MLIGDFAKKSKLTRETIRFYEKKGLLKSIRKENNYREYSENDIRIVHFINALKELGFILPEIKDILNLYDSEQKCKDIQNKLEKNLKKIENKIYFLAITKKKLLKSIQECEKNPYKKSCKVFEKFF